MVRRGALIVLGLLLSACNLAVPEVTPTIAPTRALTQTETTLPTRTQPQPTVTVTPSSTASLTVTATPSSTASLTVTPTPTLTVTRSHTPTPNPSLTHTVTPVPTDTPSPTPTLTSTDTASPVPTFTLTSSSTLTPTDTASPLPTFTPTNTDTPPPTLTPTNTDTPPPTDTLPPPSPTPLPILSSRTPTPIASPTWTIPPSLTPPPPPSPMPLPGTPLRPIDATPIFSPPTTAPVTPEAPAFVTVGAPLPNALPNENPDPPITATPALSADSRITPIGVRTDLDLTAPPSAAPADLPAIAAIPLTPLANPVARGFTLSSGGAVRGGALDLPFGGGVVRFAQNPVDPSQVAMVDPRGVLYLVRDGAPSRPVYSPFSIYEPDAPERNNARVEQVAYAPDGSRLAFRVDTEADSATENDSINDGVWIVEGDSARQVFGECPPVAPVCTVDRGGGPFLYTARDMAWSPGSDALLIRLWLPEEMRGAFAVVTPDSASTRMPDVYRYDTAHWTRDGRIVVSGRGLDGAVGFGVVTRDGQIESLTRADSIGLAWTQDAVIGRDGRLVMLGSPDGRESAQRLYDGAGRAISQTPIGDAPPERVDWSADRAAVLVVTAGITGRRYYVAELNGAVREITSAVAGSLAVEWVG